MTVFYHIHLSTKKSDIDKEFKKGKALFFSKKDSFWHDFWKDIGCESEGGYREYKVTIPNKYFTYSLKPQKRNKILKLTPKNIKGFIKLHEKHYDDNGGTSLRDDYINKYFIGIDCTHPKLNNDLYRKLKYDPDPQLSPPQGYITEKYNDISIKKVNLVKS